MNVSVIALAVLFLGVFGKFCKGLGASLRPLPSKINPKIITLLPSSELSAEQSLLLFGSVRLIVMEP